MKHTLKPVFNNIEKIHKWLFYTPTRPMEMFNACALIGFAFIMFIEYTVINSLPSYSKFAYVSPKWWWLCMILLGLVQIFTIFSTAVKSNQWSGYVLMLSGAVWALIALIFNLDSAITTSSVIYSLFAIFASITGLVLFTDITNNVCKGNCDENIEEI